jgi:hypothetical protein
MSHSSKSKMLKTYAKLGFYLGSLGLMGAQAHTAQAQDAKASKSSNLITTELGVMQLRIPGYGSQGNFLMGRASMAFNADNDKAFGIYPMVGANYTYGIGGYQYKYNYNTYPNPGRINTAGFGRGAGFFTYTQGISVEMGAMALARIGPLDARASLAGQTPLLHDGTVGLGFNGRVGLDLNIKEVTDYEGKTKGLFFINAEAFGGMQRTVLPANTIMNRSPNDKDAMAPFYGFAAKIGFKF